MNRDVLALLKSNRRDLFFVTLLLSIAAVLLIGFRYLLTNTPIILIVVVLACWVGVLIYWLKSSVKLAAVQITPVKISKSPGFFKTLGLAAAFFGFSLATFFVPMSQAFWHGGDDAPMLVQNTPIAIWQFDITQNRPLTPVISVLAEFLTPGHIDSLLWLAFFLRLCTAAAICALARETFSKSARLVSILAAVVFMINPSEPARFLAIVMANYFLASLLIWTSLWLLARSFRLGSRGLLILSCTVLSMGLLTADGAYPLALVGGMLIVFIGMRNTRLLTWLFAWFGALGIVALRLIVYLVTAPNPYQLTVFSQNVSWFSGLIAQLRPALALFDIPSAAWVSQYWLYGAAAVLLVIPLLQAPLVKLKLNRRWLLSIGLFVFADVLGVLLYSRFPNNFRTQFFAAPAQAVIWSLLLIGVLSLLPNAARRIALIILVSAVVFMVSINTMAYQEQLFEPNIRFDYLVKAFQDLHKIAPSIKPSSLVLVVDDGAEPVMGIVDYHLPFLALASIGIPAFRLSQNTINTKEISFTPSGVTVNVPYIPASLMSSQVYTYDHVIVFMVNYRDSSVKLLDKIPSEFLPPDVTAADYNPQARIGTDKVDPIRYMYYLPWMSPPTPRPDIYRYDAPFSLGENWYGYESGGGAHYRWANTDAKILVTSPVHYPSQLILDLEPGPSLGDVPLQISFELNQGAAFSTVSYQPGKPFTVALPPKLASGDVIKLHVLENKALSVPNDSRILFFRAFNISLVPTGASSVQ